MSDLAALLRDLADQAERGEIQARDVLAHVSRLCEPPSFDPRRPHEGKAPIEGQEYVEVLELEAPGAEIGQAVKATVLSDSDLAHEVFGRVQAAQPVEVDGVSARLLVVTFDGGVADREIQA